MYDTAPNISCDLCKNMPEKGKLKWKAKQKMPRVITQRYHKKHILPLTEFMESGGTYTKQMKKMVYHNQLVKMLS